MPHPLLLGLKFYGRKRAAPWPSQTARTAVRNLETATCLSLQPAEAPSATFSVSQSHVVFLQGQPRTTRSNHQGPSRQMPGGRV